MSGDIGQALAAAAARIADLEAKLAGAQLAAATAQEQLADAQGNAQTLSDAAAAVAHMANRIDELERLLAPPPQDAPVVRVVYDDGRIKYAAPDGSKFTLAADAQHRADILDLMRAGATEAIAEALVRNGVKAAALT